MVTRGNAITITATLLQNGSYGDPVPNQWISFFDQTFDTFIGSRKTDANGIASIVWDIPLIHALGPTTLNVTFYGNESLSLSPTYQQIVLTILSSTNIEINPVSYLLSSGDLLSFSVHLSDDSNNPVSDAMITVLKDDTPLGVGITNSSGDIDFEIECNSSWSTLGYNDIRVVFKQDLTNYLDAFEFIFTIEIVQIPTSVVILNLPSSDVVLDESVDIYVKLSETNHTLQNEPLQVFLDGFPLFPITSNSSGVAHLHLEVDERFTLGIHTLRIQYNGTERYSESYTDFFLSVSSPVQIITRVPELCTIGSIIEIEVTVSDSLGRPIPNSIISITDSISNQSFTTPSSSSTTTLNLRWDLLGPPGIHVLHIELTENPFLMNTSVSSTFSVWSVPEISLIHCNVDHYASPGQMVFFELLMTNWAGNCSLRPLQFMINSVLQSTVVTNTTGQLTFSFAVPQIEFQYNISIHYNGNETLFESIASFEYILQVTKLMPIRLGLDFYEVNAPLHELYVHLTLRCLNGSTPKGVLVNFNWLQISMTTQTTDEGLITLHLPVPATIGTYILYYESESSNSIVSSSGSFLIEITTSNVMSLQGVGISGIAIALIASVCITAIPIIRRKYLIGS